MLRSGVAGDRFPSIDDVLLELSPFAAAAPRLTSDSNPNVGRPRAPSSHDDPASSAPTLDAAALGLPGPGSHPSIRARMSGDTACSPQPRGPEPHRRTPVFAAIACIALAFAVFATVRGVRRDHEAPAPAASASAAPLPTAVTELAFVTSSAEAASAYRSGLVAMRYAGEMDDFERALKLDPSFGAARVQLVVTGIEGFIGDEVRAHYHEAEKVAAGLTDRDRALLEALGPVVLEQPSSWTEAARRLATVTTRFPGDAQLWYVRGWVTTNAAGAAEGNPHLARAFALDPSYASALDVYAQNLAYRGEPGEARRIIDRCLRIASSYATCRETLHQMLVQEGRCDEDEVLARQMIAGRPGAAEGHEALAAALASRGSAPLTVREALKPKWATWPEPTRRSVELKDTIGLHALTGDFASAEATARELLRLVETSRAESDHGVAARWLARILEETDRLREAGDVARAYLDRRDAWEPEPRSEDFALARDATPYLLSVAFRAGRITAEQRRKQQSAWLRAWDAKAAIDVRRYLWLHGWAAAVTTEDEARAALDALPGYEPLPTFRPNTLVEAAVGDTYLLAGRTDEAITWLEGATKTCRALESPIEHTRAYFALGKAREAKGDKAGACEAYGVVVSRWGQAKPASMTARKAKERVRALRCAG